MAALAATAWMGWAAQGQAPGRRPRLLIAETDPFTGLSLLQARTRSGRRPPEDME